MSRSTFRIRPRANVDLDEHFAYVARDSPDAAVRFFDAFWDNSLKLAAMPGMGARRGLRRVTFAKFDPGRSRGSRTF